MTKKMSTEEHLRNVYSVLEKIQERVDRQERVIKVAIETLSKRVDIIERVIRELKTQKLDDD